MKRYSTLVKTERYVFHISYKRNRSSIQENGILGKSMDGKHIKYENAVFAHNNDIITLDWYPLCLDYYGWDYWDNFDYITQYPDDSLAILEAFNRYYDIWRIDTSKTNKQWFIDDIGEREFYKSIFKKEELYIVSFGDISPEHIQRCELSRNYVERQLSDTKLRCHLLVPQAA